MRYQLLAVIPLFLTIGCSETHLFSVSVKNATPTPITVNLTKDEPQHEYFWASPEDMVEARVLIVPDDVPGGRLNDLPSGKTASKCLIIGHFSEGQHAMMRVYRGKELTIEQQLKMKPGPDRIDVVLNPGENKLVVRDTDGILSVWKVPPQ